MITPEISAELMLAAMSTPLDYRNRLVQLFHERTPASSVALVVVDDAIGLTRLKAFYPGSFSQVKQIEFPTPAVFSGTERLHQPGSCDAISDLHSDHAWCVSVPLTIPSSAVLPDLAIDVGSIPARFGLLIAEFESEELARKSQEELLASATIVGLTYAMSIQSRKLITRSLVVNKAHHAASLDTLCQDVAELVEQYAHVGVIQIWITNRHNTLLGLRGSSEHLEGKIRLQVEEIDLLEENPHSTAWRSGQRQLFTVDNQTAIAIPIPPQVDATSQLISRPVGVIVASGKSWNHNGRDFAGQLFWEDVILLEFFSDMLGILAQMLRKREETERRVFRALHGAQNSLHAILRNLRYVRVRGEFERWPPRLTQLLDDAQIYSEDMWDQMLRTELSQRRNLTTAEVLLFADVIMTLPAYAEATAKAMRAPRLPSMNNFKQAGFETCPAVKANHAALQCVFRNVIHNAVKYSRPDRGARISITYDSDDSFVRVRVQDDGIGIPTEARGLVFREGYRADNAKMTETVGLGQGLYDCKKIMNVLGGDILLDSPSPGYETSFEIVIPRA